MAFIPAGALGTYHRKPRFCNYLRAAVAWSLLPALLYRRRDSFGACPRKPAALYRRLSRAPLGTAYACRFLVHDWLLALGILDQGNLLYLGVHICGSASAAENRFVRPRTPHRSHISVAIGFAWTFPGALFSRVADAGLVQRGSLRLGRYGTRRLVGGRFHAALFRGTPQAFSLHGKRGNLLRRSRWQRHGDGRRGCARSRGALPRKEARHRPVLYTTMVFR